MNPSNKEFVSNKGFERTLRSSFFDNAGPLRHKYMNSIISEPFLSIQVSVAQLNHPICQRMYIRKSKILVTRQQCLPGNGVIPLTTQMYHNLLTDLLTFIKCPLLQKAISKVITRIQFTQIKYHKRNKSLMRILFTNGKSIPNLLYSLCQNPTKHITKVTHIHTNTFAIALHSNVVVVN